ncbi:MAG: arsenate reductase (glutaredoxin) [Proteobacteria bacterium]|nr:arsenate reductase (glutaredoxin) [Pseudomonadota bacterium]
MAKAKSVTIYHNPKCTTSCNVLAMIEESGAKPNVVEYLKEGWTKPQLKTLFAAAGVTPREAMRKKAAEDLGISDKATSAQILDAMVENPVLVERPFVETNKGARLCRPKETVRELL